MDGVGPEFLLEVKTRVAGSSGPVMAVTANHLLQTNFQVAMTGATIDSYSHTILKPKPIIICSLLSQKVLLII